MARPDRTAVEQQQQRTLARLEAVKHHFDTAQSAGRFANKVAIVTGVGSLKGIGSVSPASDMAERLLLTPYSDLKQPRDGPFACARR